jgi:hypothetical protein
MMADSRSFVGASFDSSPVVVRGDEGAVHVAHSSMGSGMALVTPTAASEGATRPDEDARYSGRAADDETANHDLALRADGAAGADVPESRVRARGEIVNLHFASMRCCRPEPQVSSPLTVWPLLQELPSKGQAAILVL